MAGGGMDTNTPNTSQGKHDTNTVCAVCVCVCLICKLNLANQIPPARMEMIRGNVPG